MSSVSEPPGMVTTGNIEIPQVGEITASPRPEIDGALAAVTSHRKAWERLEIGGRIELLDEMIADTSAVARRWAQLECERKRVPFDSAASAEEWALGPWCALSNLRQLRATLRHLERHGHPRLLPGAIRSAADGRVLTRIFPRETYDLAIWTGVAADAWMQPGVSAEEVKATAGGVYRAGVPRRSRVGVVLGAGNVSAIPFMDVLYKMFAEDQVVVLKPNPITEHLLPVFAEALRALIERGFLRLVSGGVEEAQYLVWHGAVEAVHITGSDKTYDAIVFGTGRDAAARKAENRPLLDKPVTAELGNVTPVIVVPGDWSASEFEFQAQALASMFVHGASYECIAPRLLVMPSGWDGRERLLDALRRILRQAVNRRAFYPGAEDRFSLFTDAHPEAELLGAGPPGSLPWALITGVDPDSDDVAFTTDAFAPVLCETSLKSDSVADFIDRAAGFCNDRVWGTLAAGMIAQPGSLRAPQAKAAFERAIAGLRYGTVVVNGPTFYGFSLTSPPWGAFPGHEPSDIRSGTGVVHNTFLLQRTEKTVFRAPFRMVPKPVWWVTHRHSREVLTNLTAFEEKADPAKLPAVFLPAIRG